MYAELPAVPTHRFAACRCHRRQRRPSVEGSSAPLLTTAMSLVQEILGKVKRLADLVKAQPEVQK